MALFDFFKKPSSDTSKSKRDLVIADLSIDIKNLNKEDFTQLDDEVTTDGTKYQFWSYNKNFEEWGLFDGLDFKEFSDGEKIVIFKTLAHLASPNKVEAVITRLHKILGKDLMDYNQYSYKDIEEIKTYDWLGRTWMDDNIFLVHQGGELQLVIHGIK